jgi:hypothetical protein
MTLPLQIQGSAPCGNGWPPTASGAPGPQNLTGTRSKSVTSAWVVPRWGRLCGTWVATGRTETSRTCARGAADPAPGPSDRGCSRCRAKNGASARRRYAGLLTACSQVPVALNVTQHLGGAWCGPAVGNGRKPFPIWTVERCRVRNVKQKALLYTHAPAALRRRRHGSDR